MSESKQTDNAHLGAKLLLRRYFLDKYHKGTTPNVFDACQADGVIWTHLRAEYPVRYMGVDRKLKRGRLSMDSSRLLEFPALPYDVIDVDTYGSPWRHWMMLLPNITRPTTVFLTVGTLNISGKNNDVCEYLGLGRLTPVVPSTIAGRLLDFAVEFLLGRCYAYNLTPHDAREVVGPRGSARYFGVHLIPKATSAPEKEDGREQSHRMDASHV